MSVDIKQDGELALVPFPIIERSEVLSAIDPGRTPSRGWYRSLLSAGVISEGVSPTIRTARGVAGRQSYHSVLALLAGRTTDERSASHLIQAARIIEDDFSDMLEGFLAHRKLADLPSALFFEDLSRATAKAVFEVDQGFDSLIGAGEVSSDLSDFVHVDGGAASGELLRIDLPSGLLSPNMSSHFVWVFDRVMGRSAVVDTVPAVWVRVAPHAGSAAGAHGKHWLFLLSSTVERQIGEALKAEMVGDDGLTSGEREELGAAYFEKQGGFDLSKEVLSKVDYTLNPEHRVRTRVIQPA